MKECNKCEFFEGYDYDDGTPVCSYYANGEICPYNDMEGVKQVDDSTGLKIVIDGTAISKYIRDTIQNTIDRVAREIAQRRIEEIVDESCKENIYELTTVALRAEVDRQVAEFMSGDITVGGGWREPCRTISRESFLTETIEKELQDRFSERGVKEEAKRLAQKATDDFLNTTKHAINNGIKDYFDAATRQILTDNVVSMLMCNDTYKKLSDNMNHLLGGGV